MMAQGWAPADLQREIADVRLRASFAWPSPAPLIRRLYACLVYPHTRHTPQPSSV
ncbi:MULTISPECIES: hypothetical protein [unclassified Mameliella]|uniref:hypothetical protein n=1 Tax=unclassified Mameliella TaxID=2630630 RepID=UPI00273CFA6C|nr:MULTISPECIES: hypothetical protein [unclassified Mameliella]